MPPGCSPPMLDEDAVWLFNRQIPIETLASLLKRTELSDTLRARLALSGWTRAVLLARHDLAPSFALRASIGYPELRAGLLTYAHATNRAERDIEVTWLMLHTPGLNPWIRSGLGRTTPPGERDI